ncbi:MAG TPA: ABC transporter ATP-binding protein [Vicinamibacterales bacterium]|nr:ABC transporter ATP-binding protein [Vicinamibacterales bacterium]
MEPVIAANNLSCRYRRTEAVRDLTFAVEPGTIFGLLGPNGAGKTTTIRALMNILRPSAGEVRVLGVNSRRLGAKELVEIGYVSENQQLPSWMTVRDLLAFCKPMYPTWDDGFAAKLVTDFDLPLNVRIARLSRGMRVKAALITALAYRPKLLVMDEPFSGLDPVVRDDLVRGVLERVGDGQWTVLLSSHDLDEVERLVDAIAFLDNGGLVLTEPLITLMSHFRRVEVTLPDGAAAAEAADPAWIGRSAAGRVVQFVHSAYTGPGSDLEIGARYPGARVDVDPMTLRDIFLAVARHTRGGNRLPSVNAEEVRS